MELLQTIRDHALNFLSIREHARAELRQKLLSKKFPLDGIEQVLMQLQADDLLSDARFTESFIRSRRNKGWGPVRIRYELQQHQIAEDLLNELLDSHDEQWTEAARRVRQKKFGTAIATDMKQKAKQIRFLQYRGFNTTHIKHAITDPSEDDDE